VGICFPSLANLSLELLRKERVWILWFFIQVFPLAFGENMVNINNIRWGIGIITLGLGLYFLPELSNLIITWVKNYFPNITNLIVFMNSLSATKKAASDLREFFLPLISIFFVTVGLFLVYVGLKESSDEE